MSRQLFDDLPRHIEDALRASIERFGVLVPVVKDQHGEIIDGHHRSRIADDLGVDYRVDVVTVEDEDEAREIALTLNADRRQLEPEQRREIVKMLREAGHSYRAIGGALGVSKDTVANDLDELSTDRQLDEPDRVVGLDGKSRPARKPTIVSAKNRKEADRAQAALAGVDVPEGKTWDVKRAERVAREQAAERKRQEPVEPVSVHDEVEVRHGDFREVLDDLTGQVDAIVTDPPYPREYVDLFGPLGEVASRLLKPSGVLAAMVGQTHLRDYLRLLDNHLEYRWVGAYLTIGPSTRVHQAKVGACWKPILLYQRRDAEDVSFLTRDLFAEADGDDKRYHHWGQSESGMAALVERLTEPGDLVADPFLGGGTTAVASRDLGRRFVGCDIDAAAIATARERVS